jgi:aspartyl-tRNA synthetase
MKIYVQTDNQNSHNLIYGEMAFVEQEDILNIFEGLTRHLLKEMWS